MFLPLIVFAAVVVAIALLGFRKRAQYRREVRQKKADRVQGRSSA